MKMLRILAVVAVVELGVIIIDIIITSIISF